MDADPLHEPTPGTAAADAAVTESVVIKLNRQETKVRYQTGETLLETARRAGLNPPTSCEQGNCATCMAHLDEGTVTMRANNALLQEDLDEGWVLTCQSLPTSSHIVVDYDA